MKKSLWTALLWTTLLVLISQFPITKASSESDVSDYEDDGFIVNNPNYVEPVSSDVEDSDVEDEGNAKSALSKALGSPRKASRFLKKHRFKISVFLFIVLFRQKLLKVLWRIASTPVYDPVTGKEASRVVQVKFSKLLKIGFFLYLFILFHNKGEDSTATALLLGKLTGQVSLALVLSSVLGLNSNPAFIPPAVQHYTFETLNDRYSKDSMALSKALGEPGPRKPSTIKRPFGQSKSTSLSLTEFLKSKMVSEKQATKYNSTVIVMDWTSLDTSVSNMDNLRDEVSFLIGENEKRDTNFEIILLLQSPGGSAADYSLASQQILRLRNEGINVTICVDKVAASGGYMIACTSSPGRLFASPFAIVGSIGVVGQTVNIHKVLEGWGVRSMVFRGGQHKAPLGLIGEITQEGIENVQNMIDTTHRAFKQHVSSCRPVIADSIESVATGETWIAADALDLGLVDRIVTSDAYIEERIRQGARVLKLYSVVRRSIFGPRQTSNVRASRGLLSTLSECRNLLSRLLDASALINDDRMDLLSRTTCAQATSQMMSCSL